jgi:hypothetical protein
MDIMKLLTSHLKLGGLQTNGAYYNRVPKTFMRNECVTFWGSKCFQSRVHMWKSSSYGCKNITDSLDEEGRTDAIIIDLSKAFTLVSHDRFVTKIAPTGVELRVFVWIKEFLLGRLQSASHVMAPTSPMGAQTRGSSHSAVGAGVTTQRVTGSI